MANDRQQVVHAFGGERLVEVAPYEL